MAAEDGSSDVVLPCESGSQQGAGAPRESAIKHQEWGSPALMAWLVANGLESPADFRYAFTSFDEVLALAGPQVAEAWGQLASSVDPLPSSWTLWALAGRRKREPGGRDAEVVVAASVPMWSGRSRVARPSESPGDDESRRRAAATMALDLALAWGQRGRLSREFHGLHVDRVPKWRGLQLDRIAQVEAASILAALRTWRLRVRWAEGAGEDPLAPSSAAPLAFMGARVTKAGVLAGAVPPSVPLARFNHFKWLETCLGAPVCVQQCDKPRGHAAGASTCTEQRVASDPELHVQVDLLLQRMGDTDPLSVVAAAIQLMWASVLRYKHLQRSVLTKLTSEFLWGACWKGKRKPGFRWAAPRFGPAGADVGKLLWDRYTAVAGAQGQVPYGVVRDSSGSILQLADFHDACRTLLAQRLGMEDSELFTSYSLRRSLPTLAEIRRVHPDDANALGDWSDRKSNMRVRYADGKEDSAATVKLTAVQWVARARGGGHPLSWARCRLLACTIDEKDLRQDVLARMAADRTEAEMARSRLSALAQGRRGFDVAALARRMAPPAENPLPGGPADPGRRWVAVKYRGSPRVHMLPGTGDLPLCRRRRGESGAPIRRAFCRGGSISELQRLGWGPAAVCPGCMCRLPEEQKVLLLA